jgi:2-oxoglutarate ferredoxin oxidoreductase subunit beta
MAINLRSSIIPTWCPGCHDYVIYAGIQQALTALDLPLEDIVIVYDIGCIGNMADFFSTYGIHSLHGRCIPTAIGVKLANPKLTVLAVGGDGGVYGEGLNHLISAARLNVKITVLVANNHLYSLTTGQASPTTPKGSKTKSTPFGDPNLALDPIPLLHTVNPAVFAKHVDCKNPTEVVSTIKEAVTNPGFALVDLEQVCVTFGKQLNS